MCRTYTCEAGTDATVMALTGVEAMVTFERYPRPRPCTPALRGAVAGKGSRLDVSVRSVKRWTGDRLRRPFRGTVSG